jgi:excisionase family DNA binding protein
MQYYTLEEAAAKLGASADEVKNLAKKGELRAFQDRGTMRFRANEVDELARRRGRGSDEDLQLGEASKPKTGDTPSSKKAEPEVFDFTLQPEEDDRVEIGQELHGGGSKKGPSSKKLSSGPVSPQPKPGSDSDVRLVADGSDLGFQVSSDSDVKVVEEPGPTSSQTVKPPASKPPSSRRKKGPMVDSGSDSGVRLAGIEEPSDSDVKILPAGAEDSASVRLGEKPPGTGSDSDVRLDPNSPTPRKEKVGRDSDSMLTEEIDLDAELRQAEQAAKTRAMPAPSKGKTKTKPKPGSEADLPTVSPFELSGEDLAGAKAKKKPESSSDFDLAPAAGNQSPIELGSDEIPLPTSQEEVGLGELAGQSDKSGINLKEPVDSGISLEQKEGSSDEIEFELSLDEGSTPKPVKAGKEVDSDSEFELTLDDSGGLAPLEEDKGAASDEEKDIFETDFEVPALDDESGSQAVALDESDTDLESSDFDLALGDEDIASDEESGSQVVALEDEEADAAAATVAKKRPAPGAEGEAEEILGEDEVIEDEEVGATPARAVAAPPAVWEAWAVIPVVLCSVLLFVVGLMGFEMVRSMWGYRQPNGASGVVLKPLAEAIGGEKLPE